MNVVTIPKKLAQKEDLVVMPRSTYEALLQKRARIIPIAKLTPADKRAIARSRREFARGEYVTLAQLTHELAGSRAAKH